MQASYLQSSSFFWKFAKSPPALASLATLAMFFATVNASAQIKQPGAHVQYSAELEPHGVVQWDGPRGFDEGLGLGFRASIPLFHNGPIPKINNNMAIGFGFDLAFFDGCNNDYYYFNDTVVLVDGADCSASDLWLPVVLQWNFYLTPSIAVFGEPGFAVRHTRVSREPCRSVPGFRYDCDYSDTDILNLVFYAGAKFFVSPNVAVTVRLGFPSLSVGASFFL